MSSWNFDDATLANEDVNPILDDDVNVNVFLTLEYIWRQIIFPGGHFEGAPFIGGPALYVKDYVCFPKVDEDGSGSIEFPEFLVSSW